MSEEQTQYGKLTTLCERQAEFCAVFAHPMRIRVLLTLGNGERAVSDLAAELDLSMPNLSQHLRLMRDRGCLRCRREGQQAFYAVTRPEFLEAVRLVRIGLEAVDRNRSTESAPAYPGPA